MGNCMITRKRSLAQDKKGDEPPKEIAEASGRTRSKTSSSEECDVGDEKKNVRFKLCDKDSINDIESNGMNKKGSGRVVRIRVVVTQSQLSQILKESSSKYSSSSVEQLLSTAVMLRNRKLSQSRSGGRGGGRNGQWKPALESIQEDR